MTPTDDNTGEPPLDLSERVVKIAPALTTLATKEDLAKEVGTLRAEIEALRPEMRKEFSLLPKGIRSDP